MTNRKALLFDLRTTGAEDARAGKPIEAFFDFPLERHTESLRAAYEIGYRAEKDTMRKEQRANKLARDRMNSGLNYQPICDNPKDALMSNGAGYCMCANPKHREESDYEQRGPVWHPMEEWPKENA